MPTNDNLPDNLSFASKDLGRLVLVDAQTDQRVKTGGKEQKVLNFGTFEHVPVFNTL